MPRAYKFEVRIMQSARVKTPQPVLYEGCPDHYMADNLRHNVGEIYFTDLVGAKSFCESFARKQNPSGTTPLVWEEMRDGSIYANQALQNCENTYWVEQKEVFDNPTVDDIYFGQDYEPRPRC